MVAERSGDEAAERPVYDADTPETHVAEIEPSHHDFVLYAAHRGRGIKAFNKYLSQQGTPGSRMLKAYEGEAGYGVKVDEGLDSRFNFIGIKEGATLCQMKCTTAVARDSRLVDPKLSNYSFMANGRVYQPNQDKPSLGFLINDGHNEAGYNCRVVSTNDPHVLNVVATCAMLPGTILSLPYGDEYWIRYLRETRGLASTVEWDRIYHQAAQVYPTLIEAMRTDSGETKARRVAGDIVTEGNPGPAAMAGDSRTCHIWTDTPPVVLSATVEVELFGGEEERYWAEDCDTGDSVAQQQWAFTAYTTTHVKTPNMVRHFNRGKTAGWEERAQESLKVMYQQMVENSSWQWQQDQVLRKIACGNILLFDPGANVSVIKTADLLLMAEDHGSRVIEVTGINKGTMKLQAGGKMKGPFGDITARYCPEAAANILCQADVLEHFWLTFEGQGTPTERYQMKSKADERIKLKFYKNDENLYVYQFTKAMMGNDVSARFIGQQEYHALHTTLSQQMQLLGITKEAIKRALKVEAIHRASNYIGLRNLYQLIKKYGYEGSDVTARDVYVYSKYIHPSTCQGCILGKLVQAPAISPDTELPTQVGQKVHTDIFYLTYRTAANEANAAEGHQLELELNERSKDKSAGVKKVTKGEVRKAKKMQQSNTQLTYFLAVDGYSGYVLVEHIKNREAKTILEAMMKVKGIYLRAGSPIQKFRMDGESGFLRAAIDLPHAEMEKTLDILVEYSEPEEDSTQGSSKDQTDTTVDNQTDVENSTPGRHVRVAESVIRQIKSLFRATLFGLPYILPHEHYDALVRFLPGSLNIAFKNHNDFVTAHEIFHKTRPKLEHIFNVEFGQLVASYNYIKDRDDSPRANVGIVVGRSRNTQGSAIIHDLGSHSLYVRRAITPMQWNTVFLKAINRGNKPSQSHTQFKFYEHRDDASLSGHRELADTEAEDIFITAWEAKNNVYVEEHARLVAERETADQNKASESPEAEASDSSSSSSDSSDNTVHGGDQPADVLRDIEKEILAQERDTVTNQQPEEEEVIPDAMAEQMRNILKAETLSEEHLDLMEKLTADTTADTPANNNAAEINQPRSSGRQRSVPKKYLDRLSNYVQYIFNLAIDESDKKCNLTIAESQKKCGAQSTAESVLKELHQLGRDSDPVWKYLTREQVSRLGNINILPSSMFLKEKYDAEGVFEKLKARLVACGNFQRILESFGTAGSASSPTVNLNVVFIILSISAKLGMRRKVFDVTGAFLNAPLQNTEYMRLSKKITEILTQDDPNKRRFLQPDGTMIVQLLRALYGLRSASRDWYNLLAKSLEKHGYKRSEMDSCMFVKHTGEEVCYVLVYVDDMLVCSSNEAMESELESVLKMEFKDITSKEGPNISFLGMMLKQDEQGDINVTQSGFIQETADAAGVTKSTSMPCAGDFMDTSKDTPCEIEEYRSLLMKVMFVVLRTRPDVLVHTVILSSRMARPSLNDMSKLKKIIGFMLGTIHDGIKFRRAGEIDIHMFVDASFNIHDDCRSHTGYCIFVDRSGSAAVLCRSIKQKSVSNSSTEAEIIALHDGVLHLLWILDIYKELGHQTEGAVQIYEDNQAVIQLSKDAPVNYKGKAKFIKRKYFSVHEHLDNGTVQLVHVGTNDQIADFFTKSLMGTKFRKFRVRIMGMDADESDCLVNSAFVSSELDV
jgi:hypothetical protein